jgi:3-oxoacyl-[acyl-carrier protein] reductase
LVQYNLNGRHALVCGASKGIGRETAISLAHSGAKVTVLARTQDLLDQLVAELAAAGADAPAAIAVDLHDRSALTDAIENLIATRGPVNILINNAAGPPGGLILEAETDAFVLGIERHLLAAHTIVKAVVPGMVSEGYGRIINIISTSVREPIPRLGVSNTVRGAMAGWAKTLARELPPKVTINNVLPGFTNTDRLGSLAAGRAAREGISVEDVHKLWLNDVPEKRLAEPSETAAAITFLASPEAAFIRGVSLAVDGGRMRSI